MTPNQYKEDVPIYLIYKNSNDTIDAFSLKYNVSDAGKQFENNDNLELLKVIIKDPVKPDEIVSPDYLEEEKIELFSTDDLDSDGGIMVEKPLKSNNSNDPMSILDDLDAILQKETKGVIKPKVDESEKKKSNKEVGYVKISLFDDDENN